MYDISVIVPVYKMEDKIERCIDSILSQTYKSFELILIDDGSPDLSGQICDRYEKLDSRVTVYHKENGGVASAKNYGIDKSQGEYVTFVDSDDFIEINYLEELLESKCENADMVIAGLRYFQPDPLKCTDELHLERLYFTYSEYRAYIPDLLKKRGLNYHVAKLYRRQILMKYDIRFTDFTITGGDDTVFNFDVLKKSNIICVSDKNIYNYILYSSSTSHLYSGEKWKRSKNLDQFLLQSVKELNILTEEMYHELNSRLLYSAYWSAQEVVRRTKNFLKCKKRLIEISKDDRFREAGLQAGDVLLKEKRIDLIFNRKLLLFWFYETGYCSMILGKIYSFTPKFMVALYHRLRGEKDCE